MTGNDNLVHDSAAQSAKQTLPPQSRCWQPGERSQAAQVQADPLLEDEVQFPAISRRD